MWAAYECAAQLSEEELKPSLNEDGLFDLRKVGCTTERFLASSEELSQAGALRRKWLLDNARTFDVGNAILSACVWFVVVNLLGLGFIAVRGTVRWIVAWVAAAFTGSHYFSYPSPPLSQHAAKMWSGGL